MAEEDAKTSVEVVGPSKKRLDVEVPAAAVAASIDRAFKDLQQRVRLRGFRPGKVPRAVLDRLYGRQVRSEVIEELVRDSYGDALVRHDVLAVGKPEIVVEPLGEPQVLRFSATVEVCPEITVSSFEGLEVSRPMVRVEEQDVDRVLERLAEAAAQLHPVEDRDEVMPGDIVTVDLRATADGKAVADLRRQDALIEAGPGGFPGALEERLVGMRRGAKTTVEVDYPADYANPTVAGKKVAFTVEIKALGCKWVPELDDAFAGTQGDYATLGDLRAAVRTNLEREAERRADGAVREAILDVLIERHPFDAPGPMVERRCDAMLDSLRVQVPAGPERQKTLATLRKELRPRAVRDVKVVILLDHLAKQQGIEVSDDEIAARIEAIADSANESPERVRALYRADDRRDTLRSQIFREKALSLVIDRSKIRAATGR